MKRLPVHAVASLFPQLSDQDFAALKEDIRRRGLKVPILLYGGQILDGRQRYRACLELGLTCRFVEWNGNDPWLEVQSRNLLRRHLAKEQVYAIRRVAAQQFPALAAPIEAEKAKALARRAQAKGQIRGQKALPGSQDPHRKSADAIGAQIGVSASTVKRVDRLARVAPHLLQQVAAGVLSAKHALREAARELAVDGEDPLDLADTFTVEQAIRKVEHVVRAELGKCPPEHKAAFVRSLQAHVQALVTKDSGSGPLGVVRVPPSTDLKGTAQSGVSRGSR